MMMSIPTPGASASASALASSSSLAHAAALAEPVFLHQVPLGQTYLIAAVQSEDAAQQAVLNRLYDAGFLPGERVVVLHKGYSRYSHIVVRLGGHSSFGLRMGEAACVRLQEGA